MYNDFCKRPFYWFSDRGLLITDPYLSKIVQHGCSTVFF